MEIRSFAFIGEIAFADQIISSPWMYSYLNQLVLCIQHFPNHSVSDDLEKENLTQKIVEFPLLRFGFFSFSLPGLNFASFCHQVYVILLQNF